MDRSAFADILRSGILAAWGDFNDQHPNESPYAFALIGDPGGSYLGYAIATEEGLRRVASEYDRRGYRYKGSEGEAFDNREKLAIWLRWANPDDGWCYGDFPDRFQVQSTLATLVAGGKLGENAADFEECCTDVLASLLQVPAWQQRSLGVVVGFTYGEDPRDFLRTATRANPYPAVLKLWSEYWQAEEMSRRIPPPE